MLTGKFLKRKVAALMVFVMMVAVFPQAASSTSEVEAATTLSTEEFNEILDDASNVSEYNDYMESHDSNLRPDKEYIVEADSYVRAEDMEPEIYTDYQGMEGNSVKTEEKGFVEYEVDIEEEGYYELALDYYPIEGKSSNIQRAFLIDGELPYQQLALVEFTRVWVNAITTWQQDNQGNDLKPSQTEAPEWQRRYLYDSEGFVAEKLSVYFTKGIHTITIKSEREPMVIRRLIIHNTDKVKNYDEYKAELDAKGYKDATTDEVVVIQAENADRKSSQMLYPRQDKSSPAVQPYNPKELRNNIIDGGSFKSIGQSLEWDFSVPEDGYYNISMFARQNYVQGIPVERKIYINEKDALAGDTVPFKEMESFHFVYDSSWRLEDIDDEEDNLYKFYLEKGKEYTIKMEVVLGDFAEIVGDIQNVVLRLNAIYRRVIRITGVAPDKYRDYQIEANVPGLAEEMLSVKAELDDAIARLRKAAGRSSDKEAVLKTTSAQLEDLAEDVEQFKKSIGYFKTNMSAVGTWVTQVVDQPLGLDRIFVYAPGKEISIDRNGFLDKVTHEVKSLYYSFIIDYNMIGSVSEEEDMRTITVWVGQGRDQANVIKSLIDETFTKKYNIAVNVMLVDMGSLLQATLAGQGPDVAMMVGNDLPMNYGMRNAVKNLSDFEGFEEVTKRFNESAMVPYTFEDKVFALPETQTFPMMFYRKDILKELGLEVPKTWDDMKVAMSVLANNQMELGMIPTNMDPAKAEQIWAMLLYQNNGEYYTEDKKASALDSDEAVNAFKLYTEFYTDYKLDRETSVENRFRTGESPIIITDYTTYNVLQVSAPDIKGLWEFTKVPGTIQADGTINNTVSTTGLACVMLKDTEEPDAAWEYMKWWTSTETQAAYGRELESLMGAAARYPTANMEAFSMLPWPTDDYQALYEQFQSVKGIPQVPGGYFSWRNVNNAFYKVVVDQAHMGAREALSDYVRYINDEITYKRKEFGLDTN